MRISKFRLFKWGAPVLVIAAAICFFLSKETSTHTQVVSSPTTKHTTITDDARPEIRIEQLLHLGHFGFDPSLASLLKEQKQGSGTTDHTHYEQIVATRSSRKEGGHP